MRGCRLLSFYFFLNKCTFSKVSDTYSSLQLLICHTGDSENCYFSHRLTWKPDISVENVSAVKHGFFIVSDKKIYYFIVEEMTRKIQKR